MQKYALPHKYFPVEREKSIDLCVGLRMIYAMENELPANIGRRMGDLSDLPEELRKQLQIAKVSELEQAIISIVEDMYGGVANVDEILVGLYRETNEIHQRQNLANKLYRMTAAKQLVSVPRKKGVYRVYQPETN